MGIDVDMDDGPGLLHLFQVPARLVGLLGQWQVPGCRQGQRGLLEDLSLAACRQGKPVNLKGKKVVGRLQSRDSLTWTGGPRHERLWKDSR